MPTFEKTLEIVLNPTAYAHVAKAAERLGLSIREFAPLRYMSVHLPFWKLPSEMSHNRLWNFRRMTAFSSTSF